MKKLRLLYIYLIVLFVSASGAFAGQGYGPGRIELKILAGRDHVDVGGGGIWNSRDKLHIQLDPTDGWRIKGYHVDLGGEADYQPPLTPTGNPQIGHFDYKEVFTSPYINEDNVDGCVFRRTLVLELENDLAFRWGTPWAEERTQGVAIFLSLVKLDVDGKVVSEAGAWVVPEIVTWAEEETEGDSIAVEEADAINTGESVEAEVIEVKWVGKGNKVAKVEHQKAQKSWVVEETEDVVAFDGGRWGWWFTYEMAHPKTGHFIDSPVAGLSVETPTYEGVTDIDAAFDYFPGESVEIALGSIVLGSAVADHKISPLDIFPAADTEDAKVINMARLLQSLDVDGEPQGGILISEEVVRAFEQAMSNLDLGSIDFENEFQVETIILQTRSIASLLEPSIDLVMQSAEDAKAHLEDTLNNVMFRKNVSKTADLASSKAKMNIMSVWFPAMRANGDSASINYNDEDGNLIRTATDAKPIVITYTDADPMTGAPDVWAAVSRDDGNTWKRKNISRSGDRSSFTLANGEPFYGECKKPVFASQGNKILIAWSSKYARGGKPLFSEPEYLLDAEGNPILDGDGNTTANPKYVDDIWGVGGPQRSHDYVEDGYPEVGEVPYSALWTCRGIIATQADVDTGVGGFVGDIVWFKPERVTSGRRDVNQIFTAAGSGAGFAMVWQEDPEGLRPGRAVGPGPGWGGATTAHKTDIWYSYLAWGDHTKVDTDFVIGGDPEHDVQYDDDGNEVDWITRPKALVNMSLPVRISDNDVLNMKNMGIDDTTIADDLAYTEENLTRCVKFEGGKTIVEPESDIQNADYRVLRPVPDDHYASMNCTNCHVPYGTDPMGVNPTQGAPIPLVVINADTNEYLGGFTNGDCVSCHYSNIVPRDRLIAVAPGSEADKCSECESKDGIWKDGTDGTEMVEAYYPYLGYPYIFDDGSINDGTHNYGLALKELLSGNYYTFTNNAGNDTSVAITKDGRLMDGDTGASRGNLFLQPYINASGKTSAWAIITYEETKGAGSGPPEETGEGITHSDDYVPESGKNVIYHSFDFKLPDLVSAGHIMNQPEMDESGKLIYLVEDDGTTEILDYLDRPQLAYENARRGRFILQGAGAMGTSRSIMLMVYKMGEEGTGRPSDIMMQRWVVPTTDVATIDNPYRFENVVGTYEQDEASEQWYWASGPVNMSSVTPTVTTDSMAEPTSEDPWGAVKVVEWEQTIYNLDDKSFTNPYDDARAHRGQIRGDFVQLGFSYTPNWAAARNGHDKYDFFIRRSFDGGANWTTDKDVTHCRTWTEPSGTSGVPGTKTEECNTYNAGEFEAMRNLSRLPNAKTSVIEPRIVAVPGTIKNTGKPEDKQNPAVFYVAWGTSTNPIKDPITKEQDEPTPLDLFWSFSMDKGNNYHEDVWVVNPDSDGNFAGETVSGFGWLAKGDQEQGEVQLRMTPDGSRFYSCWLDEGEEGSDIVFRRIMSKDFGANNAPATLAEEEIDTEFTIVDIAEEAGESSDFPSNSGGSDDEE